MFPKYIINWVVVLNVRVMGIVYDATHQWLRGSCAKCIQIVVVVVKDSVQS